jgi:ribosomal protein S18 acetylase RimI-like enzyme
MVSGFMIEKKLDVKIRPADLDDIPFLREMLVEAAYWRPGQERPSLEEGLARPDLVYLLADWGREGDTAVIAVTEDDEPVGAAWYRFWWDEKHSYGYIAPEIPELAIAIKAGFRGLGIGSQLMTALLKAATTQGIKKVSLSVEMDNPAVSFYQQHGFDKVEQVDNAWTMVVNL